MYETFEHTADIGLRVRAATLVELFSEAASGLFSLIVENFDQVQPAKEFAIVVRGRPETIDYLLFDWLSERYGEDHVFMDVEGGIAPGLDWAQTIDRAVASYNGDFVLHFNHPTWREDESDPTTATRMDERKVR